MADPTLFDLPSSPDEFGVLLPPANLRKLDFSGLDFSTLRRATIEYIKTYYPEDFNDFVASNGTIMFLEAVASIGAKIALRGDILNNEAFLPTALTEDAVVNHLSLINQKIKRPTPAVVDVELLLSNPTTTDIEISPGLVFRIAGPDSNFITYELYRAPGDFDSKIIIQAGKRGVIAWGVEGVFSEPFVTSSPGGANQIFSIDDNDILDAPIFVTVNTGDEVEDWTVTQEPLERFGPTEKVVEARVFSNRAEFRFGDNINGAAPLAGQSISIRVRRGGGSRGRIGVGAISESRSVTALPPANAPVDVTFRNITPSSGGTDRETLPQAKKRAPRDFAVRNSIVTAGDYAQVASSFAHPVFGAVSKSVATIRTSINANRVEIYVLAEGPDGNLVTPSSGLKRGLTTFFEDLNVLTDSVVVLDGTIKPVDLNMTIIVHKNADASVVNRKVESALDDFFSVANWEMGEPLYHSDLVGLVNEIDGVSYVDTFTPVDNILPTSKIADPSNLTGVGYNELIVAGTRLTRYYYSKDQN